MVPETLNVNMRDSFTRGDCRLVYGQVCHPKRVHNTGDDQRTMDTGKPEHLAHQHREEHCGERIGRGNQRFHQRHNRFGNNHPQLRFNKQVQRMQRDDDCQYRDEDLKRARYAGWDLRRQADGNIMSLQEGVKFRGVNSHQHGGKDPLTGEVGG